MANWSVYDDEPTPEPGDWLLVGPMMPSDEYWTEVELVEMSAAVLRALGPLEKRYTLNPIGVIYVRSHRRYVDDLR